MITLRRQLRLAQRLNDAWHQSQRQGNERQYQWTAIARRWAELAARQSRLQQAFDLGFRHCQAGLDEDYRWSLVSLIEDLHRLRNQHVVTVHEPRLRDWLQELQALEQEFARVQIDTKRSVLRVETESITLKDVPLGRFAIEFHWQRQGSLRGIHCFDVLALDPYPAAERDEVTHPHLNGTDLCAGDAEALLTVGVLEGRLCEAFLMIRSVLTTYNPRSAYVPLEEWDGTRCQDCGGRVRREEASSCGACHHDLCDGCVSSCRACDETRCGDCLTACDDCSDLCCDHCRERIPSGEDLCPSCRGHCCECHALQPRNELDDEDRCPECASASESDSPEHSETNPCVTVLPRD